jgi:ubiquinone/menaquinone biosynthesis C-methylase UbiE
MNSELKRLQNEGWVIPQEDKDGLFTPMLINEELISFPSESFSGEAHNDEASGFWAKERARAIGKILRDSDVHNIWEIGAGNGAAAIPLRNLGISVIAVEPLRTGALTLVKNGFTTFHATFDSLKLPDNSIGAIGAFDVLEHLEDPDELLSEIFRVLKPNGVFICSVPCFQWLFSDFDIAIGHYRRYNRASMFELLTKNRLSVKNQYNLFGFLVLPALISRRLPYLLGRRRKFNSVNTSNKRNFSLIELLTPLLNVIARLESFLKLRFGLSLISISTKRK